jgi:hypothetical protein
MAEVKQSGPERTKKREPGKITRAIKVALVGDGTVVRTVATQHKTQFLFRERLVC